MKTNKFMKVFVYVLVACLLLVGGGVLSACDPNGEPSDNHTHQWAEKYSYDDEYHYYECTVEGCDQHTGTELHEYDDDQDATCNKCDYERHVHTLTWKWDEDPNGNHWKEYACEHHADEKLELGKHDFSGENPNVCKVCGYDKTPPHTHHEVTKYDENQHWTSYDCEEHKDEKINPQDHTYNNDPNHEKCDGCDYNRGVEHEHSVSETWSNDATSHWKIYTCWHHDKEQLEKADHEWEYKADTSKDECKVCHYSVAHDHTKYQYTVKVDGEQHWKSYTCHPNEKVDAASHDFGEEDAEACSCGLEHIYLDVYALYSANQTYVGNEADAFGDWYEAVKAEENFDHVALNAVGDAVFYYKKAAVAADDDSPEVEYDEVVKYFAPRTYIIKASAGTPAKGIESVWFTVKATVGGELQKIAGDKTVLDAQMTGSGGTVKLTFTPVWGYSSTSGDKIVAYTVNIAGEGEYQGPYAMPSNYLYSGTGKALTVNAAAPSETAAAQTFTLTKCLGLGANGALENVNVKGYAYTNSPYKIYIAYTAKLVSGLTDGWYKLDYVTTTKGYINGFSVRIDDSTTNISPVVIEKGSVDNGGGEAFFMLYLTSENKELKFENQIGEHVANMTLTKLSETLDLSQPSLILANGTSEQHKMVYNIKSGSIAAGKYFVLKGSSSVSAKFDDGEPVSISANSIIELKGTEKKVEFTTTSSKSTAVDGFNIVLTSEFPSGGPAISKFDADHSLFIYSWTAPETATYRMMFHSTTEYKNATLKNTGSIISSSTLFSKGEGSYSQVAYFDATAETTYYFQVSCTDDTYPTIEFSIEKEDKTPTEIEADKEFEIKFDALHMRKYFTGQFESGLYLALLTSETQGKFSISYVEVGKDATKSGTALSVTTAPASYASNVFYITEEYAEAGKVSMQFTASYSTAIQPSAEVSIKVKFVKISTINQVTLGGAAFDATFDSNNIYAFKFTPENNTIVNLHFTSESDINNIKILSCTISNGKATISTLLNNVADPTKERDYTISSATAGTEYIILLIYQSATHSDAKVNTTVKKSLTAPTLYNQPGYLRTGIFFDTVDNVEKYELYEAVMDTNKTPSVDDEAFKLVRTFTSEDAKSGKYKVYSSYAFSYVNNTEAASKYFYYYVKVYGSDEYAPRNSSVTGGSTVGYNGRARSEYKVKLSVPQELVDKKASFYLKIRGWDQTATNTYIYGFAVVTPTKTEETFTVLSMFPGGADAVAFDLAGIGDWGTEAYHYTKNIKVTSGSEIEATVAKRAELTATVNIPENYIPASSSWIRVFLYKGDTQVGTNQNISATMDKALDRQYTFKFYVDEVTEADKDNYYIVFADPYNVLGQGYVLPDKVKFEMSEDLMTGTATVNFADRCKVSLTFNLPDNFSGGDATVGAYVQNEDGTLAETALITSQIALEAGQKKVEATMYVPIGYKFTLKLTLFDGYTAEPVTNLDVKDATASAAFTLSDHIDITVTVTVPEGVTSASVRLFEAENGQPKDEKTYITSETVKFEEGETSKVVHLYAPLGITEFVIGSNPSYRDTISSTTYCWSEYQKVTLDDNKGTATFAFEKAYAIHISVPHEYTSNKSDTVFIYSGDTQLYKSTRQFNSTLHNHDFTLYMPAGLYNKDAKYIILMEIVDSTLKTKWFCPALEFSFDEDTHEANVTMALTQQKDTVKVTITFPEGFDVSSGSSYSLTLYNLGTTSAAKTVSITSAQIVAGLKDNKYTFDFSDYAYSPTTYYRLSCTTGKIDSDTNTWSPKQYYAETAYAAWDEASESYVLNIEVKERQKFELTVIAPEEMTSASSQSFSLYLRDGNNASLNYWTNVSIPKGETNKTIEYYTSITDAEVIKAMHGAVQDLSDNAYYAKVTITPSGNSFSVKVEFVKKQYTFKAHIKDIPVLVSGADKYLKFEVYEKVEGGESKLVEGYTFKLLRKLASDKEELIDREVSLYSDVWDPDKYEIKISFSATSDNQAFEIKCEVVKAQDGENVYDINVTITQKEAA